MKKGFIDISGGLVITLLAILILFIAMPGIFDYFKERGAGIEACRASVVAADQLNLAGQPFTGINCPMKEARIMEDDAVRRGELQEKEIYSALAEEMRWCWYKMGEGRLEPFKKEEVSKAKYCVVCSEVEIDDRIAQSTGTLELDGFMRYLNFTNMKGEDITYNNYLSREFEASRRDFYFMLHHVATFDREQANTLQGTDTIRLDRDYFVVYSMLTNEAYEELPWVRDWISKLAGWSKTDDPVPAIMVIPEDDFEQLGCQRVFQ